jgi:hypothetical protein
MIRLNLFLLTAGVILFSGCGGDTKKEAESSSTPQVTEQKEIKVTQNVVQQGDKNSTEKRSGSSTERKEESKSVVTTKTNRESEKSGGDGKASDKQNSGQFYYSYNKEKNTTKEREKIRTTLDAYLNIRSPYERIQVELLIKKFSRDFIVRCSPCHDDYANGVIGPSLLGKDGKFIYERILEFKNGKKDNVLMRDLIKQIDNRRLKIIADEIAQFNRQLQRLKKEREKND